MYFPVQSGNETLEIIKSEKKIIMNIPNFLSLLRIILVPVIVIFLIQDSYSKP